MNIKALITTVILGSSSVAMARPVVVSTHADAQLTIRDHRAPQPQPQYGFQAWRRPAPRPMWMTLGSINQITDGNMSFAVRQSAGRLSTLKLQTGAGKSLIYRVLVQFASGATQTVELNQYLNAANPTITIDLAGASARAVTNVTVVGRNARLSSYSVLAI